LKREAQNRIWYHTRPQLVLNTTPEALTALVLECISKHEYYLDFDKVGWYTVHPAVFGALSHRSRYRIDITATGKFKAPPRGIRGIIGALAGKSTCEQRTQVVIRLNFRRLSPDPETFSRRLEVIAQCYHYAARYILGDILRDIAQQYPEAVKQLGVDRTKTEPKKPPGRPPVSEDEWQYRFARVDDVDAQMNEYGISEKQACKNLEEYQPTIQYWRRERQSRARYSE
jgi:hypothetical protein